MTAMQPCLLTHICGMRGAKYGSSPRPTGTMCKSGGREYTDEMNARSSSVTIRISWGGFPMVKLLFPKSKCTRVPFDLNRSAFSIRIAGASLAEHVVRLWRTTKRIDEILIQDSLLAQDREILETLHGYARVTIVDDSCSFDVRADEIPLGEAGVVRLSTIADAHKVCHFLLNAIEHRVHENATIEDGVHITGPVSIESGARVASGAVLRGPVYIGQNCVVGNYALVRDHTSLDRDCLVGYCADVKNTISGARTWFGQHMAALDSIVGSDCFFGGGVRTSNARLDRKEISLKVKGELVATGRDRLGLMCGDNVAIGILSGIMPGRIVGSGTTIAPGTIVMRNVGIP